MLARTIAVLKGGARPVFGSIACECSVDAAELVSVMISIQFSNDLKREWKTEMRDSRNSFIGLYIVQREEGTCSI